MIKLEFTLDQVNLILSLIAKNPYEVSAEIINEIRKQAIPQVPQEPVAEESSSTEKKKEKSKK